MSGRFSLSVRLPDVRDVRKKRELSYVQSLMPEQPAIQFALKHDFDGFITEELKHRKACNLPPLWRMATIVLRDQKFEKLTEACNDLKETIDIIIKRDGLAVEVRGPMPCTISRIERFHRMQIILQAATAAPIQNLCRPCEKRCYYPAGPKP